MGMEKFMDTKKLYLSNEALSRSSLRRISFTGKKETMCQFRLSIGHFKRMGDFPPTIGCHKVAVVTKKLFTSHPL